MDGLELQRLLSEVRWRRKSFGSGKDEVQRVIKAGEQRGKGVLKGEGKQSSYKGTGEHKDVASVDRPRGQSQATTHLSRRDMLQHRALASWAQGPCANGQNPNSAKSWGKGVVLASLCPAFVLNSKAFYPQMLKTSMHTHEMH